MPVRVRLFVLLTVLGVLALLGSPLPLAQAATASDPTASQTNLLQFTSGGQVLGFQPTGVYVASATQLLHLDFSGTAGVSPTTSSPLSFSGQAEPFQTVTYPNLWLGITATFQPTSGGLFKSSYLLAPGAQVSDIQLRYNAEAEITPSGALTLHLSSGEYQESAPLAWQEISGQRVPVEVAYQSLDNDTIGFRLGAYDSTYPLVVDPTLTWNPFFGSTAQDAGRGIVVDDSGNLYIVGESADDWGSGYASYNAGIDVFVAKLNDRGVVLWNTFLGGAGTDRGAGIARNTAGNIYVVGTSSQDWPTAALSPLPYKGGDDAFVAKLDNDGTVLWHAFLGDRSADNGTGIALDASGNVYVAGLSYGGWGAVDKVVRPYSDRVDGFVTKLAPDGSLLWISFLGGTADPGTEGWDSAEGLAVDAGGNVYVTGNSGAAWDNPDTGVRHFTPGSGTGDAFVAKLDSTGHLAWHTFLGTSAQDTGSAAAVGGNGSIYATGTSQADWPEAPVPGGDFGGSTNTFIAELNATGDLQWHTFLGGSGNTTPEAILRDASGNLYITGYGAGWGSPLQPYAGSQDATVAKVDSAGNLLWNTFLGGSGYDNGNGIALDGNGNLFVVGNSSRGWGPNSTQFHTNPSNYEDAFVVKLQKEYSAATLTAHNPNTTAPGQSVDISFTVVPTATIDLTPTGSVTVNAGNGVSCTASVADGHCSLTFATIGSKSLTATYAGDTDFEGSTSAPLIHHVNKGTTTTSITGHAPTSTPGHAYAANWSVSVNSPAAGTPTGTVSVSDGSGGSCSAPVAAGQCSLTSTSVGTKTLTATYSGDTDFDGSTSAPLVHQVDKVNTVTTITTHLPTSSLPGQPVTINFTVAVDGSTGLTPTGSVTVNAGSGLSCTASVADGHCIVTFATAGAKNIIASYAGDTNLNGSTSTVVAHQVNKANTTTSITGHAPTSDPNQAYTVNWSVTVNSPGTGTPTGTVTVSDGSGGSCSGPVATGQCSLVSSSIGAKTLTATFSGDTNFNASSATASHEVKNSQFKLFLPFLRR